MVEDNSIINKIKNTIEEKSIKSRSDFRKLANGLYNKFCKLTEEVKDSILPSKILNCSGLNTANDFKLFVDKYKITSRKQLQLFSEGAYNRFLKLTDEEKDEVLKTNDIKYPVLESIEDFRKFIKDNKILNKNDFSSRFYMGYEKFKTKLTKEEQDILLPPVKLDYSSIVTNEDIKNFLTNNKVKNRFDFQHRFTGLYTRFKNLTKEEQEEIFPNKRPDYSSLVTLSDFVKFIENNKIKSRNDFRIRFCAAYEKFLKLPKEEADSVEFEIDAKSKFRNINTLQDFQNFIDNKDNGVESKEDFRTKYPGLYNKFISTLSKEDKRLLNFRKVIVKDYSNFSTIEDFQKFIDENKIDSYNDFVNFDSGVYGRFLRIISKEKRSLLNFPNLIKKEDPYSTLESIQNYIDTNDIETYKEFRKNHKTIYEKYLKYKDSWKNSELIFKKIYSRSKISDPYNTFDDFQNFVNERKIIGSFMFEKKYKSIYRKFLGTIKREIRDKLIYYKDSDFVDSKNHSKGELFLIDMFKSNKINFITEKTYPDLKKITYLRFDFYLPDYNILVEYHGEQHFKKDSIYYEEERIECDKIKYDYAIKNNIHIIYFTLERSEYNKFGYFTEVITDPEILINKIKEIGMTNQPQ